MVGAAHVLLFVPLWHLRRSPRVVFGGDGEDRAALERLVGEVASPEEPAVSGTRRRQLEAEMALIEALGAPDPSEAIAGLWRAWFRERGAKNLARLTQVDEWIAGGELFWNRAERLAAELSAEFPDWAEPKNRLATVLYLLARYDESVRLCEEVIAMKPHHFGALSGIVMCHLKRGDVEAAETWAARQLPPNDDDRRVWARKRLDEFRQLRNS